MSTVERILLLIKENSTSASKMSKDLGFSSSAVTEWKQGKYQPSIEAIKKIARYFGVSLDYLLGETDDPTPVDDLVLYKQIYEALLSQNYQSQDEMEADVKNALEVIKKAPSNE